MIFYFKKIHAVRNFVHIIFFNSPHETGYCLTYTSSSNNITVYTYSNPGGGVRMFVELIFDQRNVKGLPDAAEIIKAELTRRVHRVFPDAEVKVKPMQTNGLISDANKSDREKLNRLLEDMFEESEQWLISDIYG